MRAAVQWSSRPVLRAVAMAVVVLLLDGRASAQASQDCQYKYTEQPRINPNCDPYAAGELIIECTVEVPPDASNISIGWFFNCDQLHNNSDITITSQAQTTTMVQRGRSRLTIVNMSDRYAGKYTCNLLGDEEFIPSDLFRLPTESVLTETTGFLSCGINAIQSIEKDKCAELSENTTIPMSLTCTEPVMMATSSSDITMTSTVSIQITSTPSPTSTPLTLPLSTSSPRLSTLPTATPRPPEDTQPPDNPTSSASTASVWLYVVVAVAAMFFVIIIILAIVFVCMCLRRSKSGTMDEQTLKQQGHSKQFTTGMLDNGAYQGRADTYPNTHLSSQPLRVSDTSDYNTLGGGDYEVVDIPADNYQRLQRPTLTPGMLPRFVSPDSSALSPTSTMTSYRTHSTTLPESIKLNGTGVPPPLPSTARRGNIPRPLNPVEDSHIFNGGPSSVGAEDPLERERIDSTSMLLPKDRTGSKSSPEFVSPGAHESLYSPQGKGPGSVPVTPGGRHLLENIPETGVVFPEPENPNPFPTYETIPTSAAAMRNPASPPYEKPLSSEKESSVRAATIAAHEQHKWKMERQRLRSVPNSSRHQHTVPPGPLYNTLEEPVSFELVGNSATELRESATPTPAFPVFETADFTAGSDSSGNNTFTPGFPNNSADYTGSSTSEFSSGGGIVPKPKILNKALSLDHSTADFSADSDYPHGDVTDYTGGSSSTAYPESDWTGNSTGDGGFTGHSTVFTFSGTGPALSSEHARMPAVNGKCSTIAGYPSRSMPSSAAVNGSEEAGAAAGGMSRTMGAPRNHYKQLDPATMDPRLKYTRLNLGKHTQV